MIEMEIPGFKLLRIAHLVLDYNGTLARDGKTIAGVGERLEMLAQRVSVHVLTADTFGSAEKELSGIPCKVSVISKESQAEAKALYVRNLGAGETAAVGNGRNDRIMLEEAALGIAVVQTEGCSPDALLSADVLCTSIADALDLLLNPLRLTATLRS